MPLYTAKCVKCDNYESYVAKVDDRYKTPKCSVCDSETEKQLDSPMVTAMGLADHAAFRSPLDGTMIYGRSDYYKHMKKHGVVPESDLKGEVAHQKKQTEAKEKNARKETIQRTIQQLGG